MEGSGLGQLEYYDGIRLKRRTEATKTFNSEQMLPRPRNEPSTSQSYNGHRITNSTRLNVAQPKDEIPLDNILWQLSAYTTQRIIQTTTNLRYV